MDKIYGIFVFNWDSTKENLQRTKFWELSNHADALDQRFAGEHYDMGDILTCWPCNTGADRKCLLQLASEKQRRANESRARRFRTRYLVHEVEPMEFVDETGSTYMKWVWKITKADLKLLETLFSLEYEHDES